MNLDGVREVVCAENSGYTAVKHQSGCDQEAVLHAFEWQMLRHIMIYRHKNRELGSGNGCCKHTTTLSHTFLHAANDDRKTYDIVYDIEYDMDLQYHIRHHIACNIVCILYRTRCRIQ
jgi:hypothetical protein